MAKEAKRSGIRGENTQRCQQRKWKNVWKNANKSFYLRLLPPRLNSPRRFLSLLFVFLPFLLTFFGKVVHVLPFFLLLLKALQAEKAINRQIQCYRHFSYSQCRTITILFSTAVYRFVCLLFASLLFACKLYSFGFFFQLLKECWTSFLMKI